MTNILDVSEAAAVLRCDETDADMLALLNLVDEYIKNATGRDWAADATVDKTAKSAARMLLVMWHENPGMTTTEVSSSLGPGLQACLSQLEAKSLQFMEFWGRNGAGPCTLSHATRGDMIDSLIALIGDDGDQKNAFEAFITVSGEIQQISTSDLSEIMFRVRLVSPSEL